MVEPGRFERMMAAMEAVGATPAGGVHRPAASVQDGAARDLLREWMQTSRMQVSIDPIGNMAGLMELAGPGAPVIMVGSHLDS